ncbi:MAG TPA: hypothetical protein VFQ53_36700 [Kofleriaceae bacterium]|nr:hypothetical protein [Kofleriaceae bacterium]
MSIEQRRAALANMLDGFTVAYDRILEQYGLRLPRHLAYGLGWWQGLSEAERTDYAGLLGGGPIGIGAWLCEGRYDRVPILAREPVDPPELVCVFATPPQDEARWALWYNDPAELPRMLVSAARDGELSACAPTLLGTISDDILGRYDGQDGGVAWVETVEADPVLQAVLDWRDEVIALEHDAYQAEAIAPAPDLVPGDPMEPWIDGWEPADALVTALGRLAAPGVTGELVAAARDKLATEPGWALVVGHALHVRGDTAGTELLVAAYRALGRGALATIAETAR